LKVQLAAPESEVVRGHHQVSIERARRTLRGTQHAYSGIETIQPSMVERGCDASGDVNGYPPEAQPPRVADGHHFDLLSLSLLGIRDRHDELPSAKRGPGLERDRSNIRPGAPHGPRLPTELAVEKHVDCVEPAFREKPAGNHHAGRSHDIPLDWEVDVSCGKSQFALRLRWLRRPSSDESAS
jgi:hypothetical protein